MSRDWRSTELLVLQVFMFSTYFFLRLSREFFQAFSFRTKTSVVALRLLLVPTNVWHSATR